MDTRPERPWNAPIAILSISICFLLGQLQLDLVRRNGMNLQTAYGHSFIVRIWLEETSEDSGHAIWRGRVTHVPSHEERYFETMQDLVSFVQRYIQGWEGGCDSDHSRRFD